ncbi:hypothetical protein ACE1TI_09835 [Alteribacillus sp. JSM 102045]
MLRNQQGQYHQDCGKQINFLFLKERLITSVQINRSFKLNE